MSEIKIVVNKLPEIDTECPFAIKSNDSYTTYPCVCDLKRNKVPTAL